MASKEEKAKRAAFADLGDDPDAYGREVDRIEAGTSSYLRRRGLIARAAEGDREAVIKLGIITLVVVVLVITALSILGVVLDGYDYGGGEFEGGGDDDFEEDDD